MQRTEDENITQQVLVLEGREAYIATGEEIPCQESSASMAGSGRIYIVIAARNFTQRLLAFMLSLDCNGDEVFLEINTVSRQRNNLKMTGYYPHQTVTVSNVSTSVSG